MEDQTNPKDSNAERSEARDERSSANFIEELKKASQEIEGTEEIQPSSETKSSEMGDETRSQRPPVTEIPKETFTPHRTEGSGAGPTEVSKKIGQDLENHLSEIVKERKRLEEDRKKIQERLSQVLNLENRIRRFLEERKKISDDLSKWRQS